MKLKIAVLTAAAVFGSTFAAPAALADNTPPVSIPGNVRPAVRQPVVKQVPAKPANKPATTTKKKKTCSRWNPFC